MTTVHAGQNRDKYKRKIVIRNIIEMRKRTNHEKGLTIKTAYSA